MLDLYSVRYNFSKKYFYSTLCFKHTIKERVEVTFSDTEGGGGYLINLNCKSMLTGPTYISINTIKAAPLLSSWSAAVLKQQTDLSK